MKKQQAIEFLESIVGSTVYLVDKNQQEEYKDKDDAILFHLPDEFDEKYFEAMKITIEQDKYELCSWRQINLPDGETYILYIRKINK